MKHPKGRECDSERECGGSNISTMHAFNAQLKPEKTSFCFSCNIHPTSTLWLAIKLLFVNCNCTFLLPVKHMSLNAPFLLCRVDYSVLDLLWISPLAYCTSTKWNQALFQPCTRLGGGSCSSAIVHPNKFPFIAFSAGVVILREVVLNT